MKVEFLIRIWRNGEFGFGEYLQSETRTFDLPKYDKETIASKDQVLVATMYEIAKDIREDVVYDKRGTKSVQVTMIYDYKDYEYGIYDFHARAGFWSSWQHIHFKESAKNEEIFRAIFDRIERKFGQ
ncbi:MAG: hypothetical protein OXU29_04195 [Gammaproteobacteria bacterium]|nr:hypothetical protein [Gammaproteobacteria bacterium]